MAVSALFRNSAMIIPGQLVTRSSTPEPMRRVGASPLGESGQVRVSFGGENIILSNVRLITRPSGRKRHLSRYLVGISNLTGAVVEIFLETIKGARNLFFHLKGVLQRAALKLVSRGLNPRQQAAAMGW